MRAKAVSLQFETHGLKKEWPSLIPNASTILFFVLVAFIVRRLRRRQRFLVLHRPYTSTRTATRFCDLNRPKRSAIFITKHDRNDGFDGANDQPGLGPSRVPPLGTNGRRLPLECLEHPELGQATAHVGHEPSRAARTALLIGSVLDMGCSTK